MIHALGQTPHFTIQYQDNLSDALRRAQALRATVESDFGKLMNWFGVGSGFGPSNRVTVSVDTASLAGNSGARIIEEIVKELAQAEREEPALAREVMSALADRLRLSVQTLRGAAAAHGERGQSG